MGYVATTGVIIYWNSYQPFATHWDHHVWLDEYNSYLYIEDKYTPGYLLLQQDPESLPHNSDLLNLIPCKLYITSTPFNDTTILTYEIELHNSGNKVGFNLVDDEDFKITISLIDPKISGH